MIDSYLVDTVTLKKNAGTDQWNERSYQDYTIRTRIDFSTRLVYSPNTGEQVVSRATLLLRGNDKSTYVNLTDVNGYPVRSVSGDFILVVDGNNLLVIGHEDKIVYGSIEYEILQIRQMKHFSMSYLEIQVR